MCVRKVVVKNFGAKKVGNGERTKNYQEESTTNLVKNTLDGICNKKGKKQNTEKQRKENKINSNHVENKKTYYYFWIDMFN